MEFIYNNIYRRDDKECMDISFYYDSEKQERDYVEIDNLQNLSIKPAKILYENLTKKTYGIMTVDFIYDLDTKNKKVIFKAISDLGNYCEIEFDLQILADAAAESIYRYSEIDKYIASAKNNVIDKLANELFNNDHIVIENHDYNEMFKIKMNDKLIGIGNRINFYSSRERIYIILDNIVSNIQIDNINSLSMKVYFEKENYTAIVNSFTLINKEDNIICDNPLDKMKIMIDLSDITIEAKSDNKIDFMNENFENYANILYSKLCSKSELSSNNDTIINLDEVNIFDDLNEF